MQDAELEKLEDSYRNIQNTEVDKEVTVATPNSRKKHRVADAAAYSTTLPLQYFAIIQIGKTGKDGKPVKREQEAIADIEAHTDVKVEFIDYEKYTLDSDGPTN